MRNYLDLLQDILDNGADKGDRTGTGTRSVFGRQLRFDLQKGFPLLTTKKVFWRGVVEELLWFLRGETNVRSLQEKDIHIWDDWADENGELGPVYGKQWRAWEAGWQGKIDQIHNLIYRIKTSPDCRRLIVSAWNPAEVNKMALPPCHCLFQFYVADGKLSCQLYQRSCDVFLGVPFNIASYALLTYMVAHVTGLEVGEFVHTYGDCHIYNNHFDQVREQLSREPRPLPKLHIVRKRGNALLRVESIDDFEFEDFDLVDYNPHPAIKAPISI